jgi:hypothetical protein
MNISLSCGPILEPLIAIALSSIISIILFFYIIKKAKKSEFYEIEFLESTISKKIGFILLFTIITICLLTLIFFLLFFVLAGIIFGIEKL